MILAPSRRLWLPTGLPTWADPFAWTAGAFQRRPSSGAFQRNPATGALRRNTATNTTCCCSGCCGSSWTVTFTGITLSDFCSSGATVNSPCAFTSADLHVTFANPNVTVDLLKITDTCVNCEYRATIPNFVTVTALTPTSPTCLGTSICSTTGDLIVYYGSTFGEIVAYFGSPNTMSQPGNGIRGLSFYGQNTLGPCTNQTVNNQTGSRVACALVSSTILGSGGQAILTKH